MKNQRIAISRFKLLAMGLASLFLLTNVTLFAANRDIGGYVDRAESRFVRNVWNFIKNFSTRQNVGSYSWQYIQYYWAEPFEFGSSHQNYVDYVDLAYVAGHGSEYYIQTNQSTGTGFDFRNAPPYGDLANNGDLEFLIIESCNTVASAPEHPADWWTPYNNMFQGLHQFVGFRTLSVSDNGIPNNFANRLKGNQKVWQSWFAAVDDERYWIFNPTLDDGAAYPGFASVICYASTANDRIGSYAADPAGGTAGMWTYWQY